MKKQLPDIIVQIAEDTAEIRKLLAIDSRKEQHAEKQRRRDALEQAIEDALHTLKDPHTCHAARVYTAIQRLQDALSDDIPF